MRATLFVLLGLAVSVAAAVPKRLPDGVALYWNCDDDAHFGWRDNHWQKGGSERVRYDAAVRKHGKAALRIDGKAGEELRVCSLTCPASVATSERYVLRFWSRTEGVAGKALVRLLAHGPKTTDKHYDPLGWVKTSPELHYVLPARSDWALQETAIGQMPGGTARLFVYLVVEGEGTAWFDEVSIAREGVSVPLGGEAVLDDSDYAGVRFSDDTLPGNLLANGGFEEGMRGWPTVGSDPAARVERVDGAHALRFDAAEFSSFHVYQRAKVDPRRRYRLSLRARTADKGVIGYFFTQVLPFNKHGTPMGWVGADHATEFTYVTGVSSGWVEREQEFGVRPDTETVVVYLRVQDTIGTVWVDDVKLVPLALNAGE